VNLFIASELNWKNKGVRIRQETNFPEEQAATLIVKTNKQNQFPIRIRIPYWIEGQVKIKINGKQKNVQTQAGSYMTLKHGEMLIALK